MKTTDFILVGSILIFMVIPIIIPLVMWQFLNIKESSFYRYARIMRKILAVVIGIQVVSAILSTPDWSSFAQIFGMVVAKVLIIYCLWRDWIKTFGKDSKDLS